MSSSGNWSPFKTQRIGSADKSQPRSRKCGFCGKNSHAEVFCGECEQRRDQGEYIYIKRCCVCGRAVAGKRLLYVYNQDTYCCTLTGIGARKCVGKLHLLMK